MEIVQLFENEIKDIYFFDTYVKKNNENKIEEIIMTNDFIQSCGKVIIKDGKLSIFGLNQSNKDYNLIEEYRFEDFSVLEDTIKTDKIIDVKFKSFHSLGTIFLLFNMENSFIGIKLKNKRIKVDFFKKSIGNYSLIFNPFENDNENNYLLFKNGVLNQKDSLKKYNKEKEDFVEVPILLNLEKNYFKKSFLTESEIVINNDYGENNFFQSLNSATINKIKNRKNLRYGIIKKEPLLLFNTVNNAIELFSFSNKDTIKYFKERIDISNIRVSFYLLESEYLFGSKIFNGKICIDENLNLNYFKSINLENSKENSLFYNASKYTENGIKEFLINKISNKEDREDRKILLENINKIKFQNFLINIFILSVGKIIYLIKEDSLENKVLNKIELENDLFLLKYDGGVININNRLFLSSGKELKILNNDISIVKETIFNIDENLLLLRDEEDNYKLFFRNFENNEMEFLLNIEKINSSILGYLFFEKSLFSTKITLFQQELYSYFYGDRDFGDKIFRNKESYTNAFVGEKLSYLGIFLGFKIINKEVFLKIPRDTYKKIKNDLNEIFNSLDLKMKTIEDISFSIILFENENEKRSLSYGELNSLKKSLNNYFLEKKLS